MRKLLIAFDGTHFSQGAMNFVRMLNEQEPVVATGIFLPQVVYANLWSYADASAGPLFVPLVEDNESKLIEKNVSRFTEYCLTNKIDYKVHKDFFDFALPELKKESRFGDLLILGSETFYENIGHDRPNEYLKEALHSVECPVMIVPEKFEVPNKNILACDGSAQSVFAIKLFSYLFPAFRANKTIVVTLPPAEKKFGSYEPYVRELVTSHYPDSTLLQLDVDPNKYFATWLLEMNSCVLVAGSYSRSFFSELFRHSFVANVIRDHKVPVFIAHS
jgi:hypothetical protein